MGIGRLGSTPQLDSSSRCILGIDPALGTTGYGLIRGSGNRPTLIEAGVIRVARSGALEKRLLNFTRVLKR